MGKLQRDLEAEARRIVTQELAFQAPFRRFWDQLTVLLCGSAVTEYADAYSGIDLLVLAPRAVAEALQEALAARPGELVVLPLASRLRVQVTVQAFEEARAQLERYEDPAMATYPSAVVLHDPQGRYPELVAGVDGYSREALQARIAERYRHLRRRQASLAWNVRRGQPYMLLDNLVRYLEHALSLCFLLEGKPPAGRKWLLQGALRTETGRRLRPLLLDLFSSLGAVATLGGTRNLRENALYRRVAAITDQLEKAIQEAGFRLEWPAGGEAEDTTG